MNCYNHPILPAVAQCIDCTKGLCTECAYKYSLPICDTCNRKRINTEKNERIRELILTYSTGIILGILFTRWTNRGLSFHLMYAIISYGMTIYIFSGIISGWKTLTRLTPEIFLFMPIIGWIFYFIIKLSLSLCLGIIMLPIRTTRNISRIKALQKIKT